MTVTATIGRDRSRYRLAFGVRKVERRPDGALLLNGHRLRLRGASIHEDDPREGAALSASTRSALVRRLRQLGATVTRSHYPLHPALLEALDRSGILYWSQAPVYQLPNALFDTAAVRRAGVRACELMVRGNANHPSVLVWSLANEPAGNEDQRGQIGPGLARYIRDASRSVRRLDSTRLVAFDRQSRIGEPVTHPSYRYLDALGIHDYFGWYESLIAGLEQQRPATATGEFGGWLDQIHAANPRLALFVTEYGAEANRAGPPTEKGTFEFQRAWMRDHLRIYDSRSYLNGAIAWILRDFRVHPTWHGGNPKPNPPWNNKGLVDETGAPKPAFFEMQRLWRRTRQLR